MYTKPDFIRVDLKIEDNFATYNCIEDSGKKNNWTGTDFECSDDADRFTYTEYWGAGLSFECYSTPPQRPTP